MMIALDSKVPTKTTASPSLLPLASENSDTPIALTFSELLKGLNTQDEGEVVQNGTLVLALGKESDTKSVHKSEKKPTLKESTLELNPQLTQNLTPHELKLLLKDAKKYLKSKIIESEGFKKSEIKALPKTLKGLVAVAKKFGLDMSKITLEEIKVDPKITAKLLKKEPTKELAAPTLKQSQHTAVQQTAHKTLKDVIVPKEMHAVPQKMDKVASRQKEMPQSKELKAVPEKILHDTPTAKKQATSIVATDIGEEKIKSPAEANIPEVAEKKSLKKIQKTPLFKAQTQVKLSTEQMVHTRLDTKLPTNAEAKTPKQKADETLKMLLRGEKVTQKDVGFTADFSVATAKVIAPKATTSTKKALESLLSAEQNDSSSVTKTDGLNVAKADSFEVKLNEAKQMTKYLSQDVKTAIEDYKSPFTRVKVQLNPQRLGEIDLTVVQRGKNLHINLSSNNAAVNALAMNAQDLKVQLANNGINNATLNFNNNASDSSQGGFSQQQQNSQQQREAKDEYNYFENEEKNEEIVSSLEIVVPHYA